MNELFSIAGKVAVITGAGGVLGGNIAQHFVQQGAKVVAIDIRQEQLDNRVAELKQYGNDVIGIIGNVLDIASLEKVAEEVVAKWGQIDILLNIAGGNMPGATIGPNNNIFDLKLDDFRQVIDLNLMGTVVPTIVFSKYMVDAQKGNIINISSASALRPLSRVAGYGAAKAAVTNFTKYMAGELAIKFGENFRVNALCPGFFITEQNRNLLTNPDGSYTDRGNAIIAHTPFKRFGNPDELLGALHFLVSDASKFVTGTVSVVDGGFDAFSI